MADHEEPRCPKCGGCDWTVTGVSYYSTVDYRTNFKCLTCRNRWHLCGTIGVDAQAAERERVRRRMVDEWFDAERMETPK